MKSKIEYNDYPLEEVEKQINERIFPRGGYIHQKWTCNHCGERQTMEERDTLFRSGKCEECGKVSLIHKCNYIAVVPIGGHDAN